MWSVEWLGHRWQLLDARLFWRKLILLIVFFGLFVPIYVYRTELALWYGVFLLLLHVYILIVFLFRIKWRVFAEHRKAFAIRVVAIATFVLLLTLIKVGSTPQEILSFVAISGLVHVALLLSLTVDVRPLDARPATQDRPAND